MSLSPLFQSLPPIPSHAIVALIGLCLGVWQLVGTKGTSRHRAVGWLFVIAMAYVALSALFIHALRTFGIWSPIHLLIPITLWALWRGVGHARAGRIRAHQQSMLSLFLLALVVTGAFTLYPGRVMHAVVFGSENTAH